MGKRNSTRAFFHLSIFLFFGVIQSPVLAQDALSYQPVESDFRPVYASDKTNQRLESWHDYWNWVLVFYRGSLFSEGWNALGKKVLSRTPNDRKNNLVVELNRLGRLISADWAKDNSVRKIDTRLLANWNSMIAKALDSEREDYETLSRAISEIAKQADAKVGVTRQ